MRFGKISAAVLAACIMATSTAALASAVASEPVACLDTMNEKQQVYFRLLTEKDEEAGLYDAMNSKILEAYGFRVTATFEGADADDAWFGGGIGANSQSTGWKQIEWGTSGKTITIADGGVIEWKNNAPIFAETDTYAHLWFQTWSGTIKSVDKIEVLDKDGNALWTLVQTDGAITEAEGTYQGIWKETDPDLAAAEEETAAEEEVTEETATVEEDTKEAVKEEEPQSGEFTAEFGAQFDSSLGDEWPSFSDKTVKFDYDKEATISLDMGSEVAFGGNYIAVNTDVPYIEDISTGTITSFKLDGEEIPLGETYVNGEGTNGGVRLTILNKWNDQIAEQPLNTDDLPATFQTIEIKFVIDTPAEVAVDEAEIDWSQWDEAAAIANNESFELGGKIDLCAALGENWNKFTKVEADFTWDAGTGWCGGAGIGGGATLADGTAWISGPEFGAANANEGVVNDGKVTQTIIDMNGETLATVAAVNDDGTTSFGELQVQNWWNGTEANAKVTAIRFLDATDTVVAELTYGAAAAAPAQEVTVTAGDVAAAADSSKGSPDTGVADVAAVAGLAVVAAGAFMLAKKRK